MLHSFLKQGKMITYSTLKVKLKFLSEWMTNSSSMHWFPFMRWSNWLKSCPTQFMLNIKNLHTLTSDIYCWKLGDIWTLCSDLIALITLHDPLFTVWLTSHTAGLSHFYCTHMQLHMYVTDEMREEKVSSKCVSTYLFSGSLNWIISRL